ncbi:MAG: acyltransferase [Alphaproteobacteria bacterium]|nr:acyltransferase [Alphaproteobacteria bacterium]
MRRLGRRLAGRWPAAPGSAPAPGPPSWQRYAAYVRIHPEAEIAPSATLKIFDPPDPPRVCLEIGARSHVFASFAILRPEATIRIGQRCQLGASNFVCAEAIDIGDDVLMAWGITVMDNDAHALDWRARMHDAATFLDSYRADPDNPLRNKNWSAVPRGRIAIGDKSWIGFNASILKGVTIGEKVVVGAMSVVTHSVPANTVVAGNPARVVRNLPDGAA